ncbi:MAG: Zn-dependent protease [Planctomycetota bacterium]|nr:MAG: Zn-dependent protease [Planctomycetota bacterium]
MFVRLLIAVVWIVAAPIGLDAAEKEIKSKDRFEVVETKLTPIAAALGKPGPGDWLANHREPGQTFAQYMRANPVLKNERLTTMYLCLVGDFTRDQERVLKLTMEYLGLVYAVPVKVHRRLSLDKIPDEARRTHPTWGDKQILTTYVLDGVLAPERTEDALAYLAFTSSDLWPGENWNFVFGQARLRQRLGVWSIYRNGDPSKDEDAFQLCLRRTLKTAVHETGHILTIQHCTAFQCGMNGSNNRTESDSQPLHFCPVCLRKVCWNLRVEPVEYLSSLEKFCRREKLTDEADWYRDAVKLLQK